MFSCFKMADKIFVVKSVSSTKAKSTIHEEDTEKLLSFWCKEEVLFNCSHKNYFKTGK